MLESMNRLLESVEKLGRLKSVEKLVETESMERREGKECMNIVQQNLNEEIERMGRKPRK